jgi:asparagine synthase (glutamine-hydrolysing)
MASQLTHRGPEGKGFWRDGLVGLAHTRLSIIDLEGGAQPIANEDGTMWVVLNGEIFNYVELRSELESRGHRFRTQTDTEVILHLYEDSGLDFVHRLNGQFAIGLWDGRCQRLVLARDRPGIAPLFYAESEGRLLFASEIKALLPLLGSPRLDPVALDQIMTFWAPLGPGTIFQGVREISPGHLVVVEGGRLTVRRYWDWDFPTSKGEFLTGSETQLAEELRELLLDATRIRLRADVPVGAYLSGGIDSSTLVSLVNELGISELRTFSIAFQREDLDESLHQRQMIEHVGALHSGITCSQGDVAEAFFPTIRHTEVPVLRTAPAPMRLLSKLVRDQQYKVVLTGEGADEILGGYDIFKEAKVRRFWARQPDSAWRPLLLKRLYPYLDVSSVPAEGYLRRFFGIGLDDPESALFAHLPRWSTTAKAKAFFSSALRGELASTALDTVSGALPSSVNTWHPFNRWEYIEAKILLASYLLSSQGDRMLMSNSVEGRFPFLDHRVIEFANRLDPRLKMKVLSEKHLLKVAMRSRLPSPIVQRSKQPYRAPDVDAFFQGGRSSTPYVEELLSEETVRKCGYFDPAKVSLLTRKARTGSVTSARDNQAFVGILSTQIWHHLFVERYHQDFAF